MTIRVSKPQTLRNSTTADEGRLLIIVRILVQTSKTRHPYDRSLPTAAISRIVRGSFKVFDDLLRVNVGNPAVRFFEAFLFSQLHHHQSFFLNISTMALRF